ncbi:uncharacterized protein [Miscanthus floridulus]|uniref:uncharacterized protein n=1 Tax=Miscanthus floridulus TaxID=154761 RepID=UPI0034593CD0
MLLLNWSPLCHCLPGPTCLGLGPVGPPRGEAAFRTGASHSSVRSVQQTLAPQPAIQDAAAAGGRPDGGASSASPRTIPRSSSAPPRLRRRFRELHRTPPMLGFLHSSLNYSSRWKAKFVRTAASCPPIAYRSHCWVLDARHGRVLLRAEPENALVIWDPIADEQKELPLPKPSQPLVSWNAAVLCAAHGSCDHLDCHRRSFLVGFVCTDTTGETTICTYSCDTATWTSWSDQIFAHQQPSACVDPFKPSALVGNALYFGFYRRKNMILKYELESRAKSVIDLPHIHRDWCTHNHGGWWARICHPT